MRQPIDFFYAMLSSVVMLAFGIGIAALCTFFVNGFSLNIKLSLDAVWLGTALGVAVFALVYVATRYLEPIIPSLRSISIELQSMFGHFNWAMIVLISIMAGVSEELLFRGVLQSLLVDATSPLIGIVISSAVFGALHCLSRTYVVLAFLVSLLIGAVFYVTGDLITVMVLHAVYDFFAFRVITTAAARST